MRKKGVELLNANDNINSSSLIIQQLEKIIHQELPIEIKIFLKYFKTGQNDTTSEMGNAKRNFDGIKMDITSIDFLDYTNNYCRFSHFYNLDKLPEIWKVSIKDNPYFLKHNVLPIGFIGITHDFVFFSKKDGTIWRSYQDKKEIFFIEFIAEDIFNFISKLKESNITDQDFKDKKIFKNWDEDFWRVREENE